MTDDNNKLLSTILEDCYDKAGPTPAAERAIEAIRKQLGVRDIPKWMRALMSLAYLQGTTDGFETAVECYKSIMSSSSIEEATKRAEEMFKKVTADIGRKEPR